jgi:cleavage stimulation factor subunit 3
LRYVAASHDATTAAGVAALRGAHEFALDRLGDDMGSAPLWADYLRFLRTTPPALLHPSASGASAAESARMVDVRKAFNRALGVPHGGLDGLWREYESFEMNLSKALARPLLTEAQPRVVASRAALVERRRGADAARAAFAALPPSPPRSGGAAAAAAEAHAAAVRAWLAAEHVAAAKLPADVALRRVGLAWDQALSVLYRWPDMWAAYAHWHAVHGRAAAGAAVLARAVAAVPECLLLWLALAEAEEASGDVAAAKQRYEQILERVAPGTAAAEAAAAAGEDAPAPEDGGSGAEDGMSDDAALTWIHYMRAARRAEGAAAARRVFARARASRPRCAWRVFAAAASLEHSAEGDAKVARNIYELGLKLFPLSAEYVLSYADFLIQRLNDATNARVLFERALASLDAAAAEALPADAPGGTADAAAAAARAAASGDAVAIWDAYVAFEYAHGSLEQARGVDARRAAALGVSAPGPRAAALELVSRFSFGDLVPVSAAMIDHFAKPDRAPPRAAGGGRGAVPPPLPPPGAPPAGAPPPPAPPPGAPPPSAQAAAGAQAAAAHAAAAAAAAQQQQRAPPMPPADPLAAAGAHELASFLASLPPTHAIAYLPIPSVDAVLIALMRAEPEPGAGTSAAVVQALAAAAGGAPLPPGMPPLAAAPQQQPPQQMMHGQGQGPQHGGKRRAEEAGFAVAGGPEEVDVFRARMRARTA